MKGRLLPILLLAALPAQAAVLRVTKTADTLDGACDADCSLREAVAAANALPGKDFLLLGPGAYTLARPGRGEDLGELGDLDVRGELVVLGAGAERTVVDGAGLDRVFHADQGTVLELRDLAVRNGHARNDDGGGIHAASLVLAGCLVTGNRAGGGGGGIDAGNLDARDSTVAGNEALWGGGGIFATGRMVLENVTVSGNRAERGGGMLLWSPENTLRQVTVTGNSAAAGGGVAFDNDVNCAGFCAFLHLVTHSVVAGNQAPEGPDCQGALGDSSGFNVFGVGDGCAAVATDRAGTAAHPLDARLSPLGSHRGPTPTHALLPGSPAVDLAPAGTCTAADQRGGPRAVDGDQDGAPECDAGAFEAVPGCEPEPSEETALCLGNRFRVTAQWTAQGSSGIGRALPLTADTGAFWFFGADNLEMMVKVLDGCALNQRFWVFLSGLTDVQVEVLVEDSVTGERWTHDHTGGSALPTLLDTDALAVCSAAGPAIGGTPLSFPAAGSVFRVTTTADGRLGYCDHDCSLREAMNAANLHPGTDAILLGPGVYTLALEGRDENASITGDLDVETHLVILGAGAAGTVLDGGGIDRVLHVRPGGSLELHGVTVRNGWARDPGGIRGNGGGILAEGPLRIEDAVVAANRADHDGGGIQADHLTLLRTTLSGNEAGWYGGGISGGPWLHMTNATVSGNRSAFGGGGVIALEGDVEIAQSTLAGNRSDSLAGGLWLDHRGCIPEEPASCGTARFSLSGSVVAANSAPADPDCSSLVDNLAGHNVFGTPGCRPGPTDLAGTVHTPLDPRLGPLGDHGGPTPTHLPLPGSPAIDFAGATCPATDQRGAPRPAGPSCDAGAVEAAAVCLPGPDRLCLQDGRFAVTVRWTAQGGTGSGRAVPLALDTGAFWFFDPANLEMTLKVLDGCPLDGHYWVFVSGLTDVGVEITVEDTRTGNTWTHSHAAGTPLQPRLDTDALECVQL